MPDPEAKSAGSDIPSRHPGQLANGLTGTGGATPAQIAGLGPVSGVRAGGDTTAVLKLDGTLEAWGYNHEGQVGNPAATTQQTSPVQVVGPGGTGTLGGITALAVGHFHSLALKNDGTVWAWGRNDSGQLGATSTETCTTGAGTLVACTHIPLQVQGPGGTGFLTGVVAVAAGQDDSLALKSDGSVWAWGFNGAGELGDGTTTNRSAPVQVVGPGVTGTLSGVTAIAAGQYFSLALKTDGSVWSWGINHHGELGMGSFTPTLTSSPVQVVGSGGTGTLGGIAALAGGGNHALTLKTDGTVWTWGAGTDGQLGTGPGGTVNQTSPVQVVGTGGTGTLSGISALAGGDAYSLALKSDGTVWSWGFDHLGQLGYTAPSTCQGTDPCNPSPAQVISLSGMTRLAGSTASSFAASSGRQASTTYSYDKLYRLTGATGSLGTNSYSYDPTGNRLSRVLNGSSTGYSYDKADRILTAGSTNYTVNNTGNLVARGSDTFDYDQANRLTRATVGGASGTYIYDGDGKRSNKTVGTTMTTYVYSVVGGLPILLDDGARKYVWGAGGLAYTVDKTTAAVQVYHTDGLSSVRAISDGTGSVLQTYQTDEFGIPTITQGTSAQPFGFTGEQRDPEDGLMYLRARMYDPTIGRFVGHDPLIKGGIGSQGWNRYAYTGNNPTTGRDPSGLCVEQACGPGGTVLGPCIGVGPFSVCLPDPPGSIEPPDATPVPTPVPGCPPTLMRVTLQRGLGQQRGNLSIPLTDGGNCLGVTGEQVIDATNQLLLSSDVPRRVLDDLALWMPYIYGRVANLIEGGGVGPERILGLISIQRLAGTDWRFEVDQIFGRNLRI